MNKTVDINKVKRSQKKRVKRSKRRNASISSYCDNSRLVNPPVGYPLNTQEFYSTAANNVNFKEKVKHTCMTHKDREMTDMETLIKKRFPKLARTKSPEKVLNRLTTPMAKFGYRPLNS
jgi:hypothetical protein